MLQPVSPKPSCESMVLAVERMVLGDADRMDHSESPGEVGICGENEGNM